MNAAPIHLLLNHLPLFTALFALALLLLAAATRDDAYQRLALVVCILAALFAIPVYLTGEPAEDVVASVTTVEETFVEPHEEAALVSLLVIELLGITAAAALWSAGRSPSAHRVLVRVTLVLALLATASMGWTANLGGQIRHSEIRNRGRLAGVSAGLAPGLI